MAGPGQIPGRYNIVVRGEYDAFDRSGKTYDLRYDDELYALHDVFGPQLDRKKQGDWPVAPS